MGLRRGGDSKVSMSASVRIESDAFTDPRFDLLAILADLPGGRFEALGRMAHIWRYCTDRQTHTVSDMIVGAILGTNGPKALVESGLGEATEDGIKIKGTEGRIEWLGRLRENASRGGLAKKASVSSSQMAGQMEARRKPDACPPSPSLTPTTKQREEDVLPSPEPAFGVSVLDPTAFPCVGQRETWTPPQDLLLAWASAYPALDIAGEIARARAWAVSNPAKRKTARGMPRFLNSWLERAQNSGRGNGFAPPRMDASAEKSAGRLSGIRRFMERRAGQQPNRTMIGCGND